METEENFRKECTSLVNEIASSACMELFEKHPLLIPQNAEQTIFNGFLTIKEKEFRFYIELPKRKVLKGARIRCDWKLKQLLRNHEYIIQQRLEHSPALPDFLQELQAIVERHLPRNEENSRTKNPGYYSDLIGQLEGVGWQRLVYVDAAFKELHIRCEDAAGRAHVLQLHLDVKHPDTAPRCIADIPAKFSPVWSSKSTLKSVCSQYENALVQYQLLWDLLDDIDANTWVLEPEKPMRKALYRRIALGNNASVHITIDPSHPTVLPECQFLGAEHVTNPLRENLNKNIDKWDTSASLLKNLQTVLATEFPSPSNTKKEDVNLACGICYAYRLGSDIPEQVCEDSRCGQPFHQSCLYEWLRALPSSRQSFNVVFGECPYCSKPLTVKMPAS